MRSSRDTAARATAGELMVAEPELSIGDTERRPNESLDDYAYGVIQRMLVRLEIPPASPIDDADLAKRLGVGRTPVRRALKRLQLEGLVAIYPRRGTFATDISIESITQLTDFRIALESLAAEKAAENHSTADMSALREIRKQLDSPPDEPEPLFDVFKKHHDVIYELANNPYLAKVCLIHYQISYRIWYAFEGKLKPLQTHIDFHKVLADAILEGNAERARELAAQHVVGFREEVRSSI